MCMAVQVDINSVVQTRAVVTYVGANKKELCPQGHEEKSINTISRNK